MSSIDRAAAAVLSFVWAACFALSASAVVNRTAMSPLYVARAAGHDDYPRVVGFKAWIEQGDDGLQVGDRLLELGGTSLRGAGALGVASRIAQQADPAHRLDVTYARNGRQGATTLVTGSFLGVLPVLPVSCAFLLAAVVIRLRAPPSPTTRAFFFASIVCAIAFASYFAAGERVTTAAFWISMVSFALAPPLVLIALSRFPDDRAPAGLWALVALGAPWAFAVYGPLQASNIYGMPFAPRHAAPAFRAVFVLWVLSYLAIATRNYLRTGRVGRRRLRWFIFGAYAASVPPVVGAAVAAIDPVLHPVYFVSLSATALFPLCILISVVRYNLFDVDRLISAAASYNVIAVAVIGFALLTVPPAGDLGARLLGLHPMIGQIGLSLLLAWGLVEGHRQLRPRIEKVFFPERYRVDTGGAELLSTLSDCSNAAALATRTGSALGRLMRPDVCVIYARHADGYEPTYVRGRGVPPIVEQKSSLVDTLRSRGRPLLVSQPGRNEASAPLGAVDRAALATLDARVVVPVCHRGDLESFICLGPKQSGDVYTPIDLTMLEAVADKLSTKLALFDDADIIEQSHAMQRSMRRYVPGAVATRLASGRELDSGASDVSVLFVDIRAYTAYSADRPNEEIFSTINQYTKAVSVSVTSHGGSVVEFNGDGMMAVFGAPNALPSKEREAVAAARQILVELARLPPIDVGGHTETIPVGIGIATGEVFVGNVHAADRMIWTALGSTVNLAARLQSLSKELAATIIVDRTTWRALEDTEAFSLRSGVEIRGFACPHDVYAL